MSMFNRATDFSIINSTLHNHQLQLQLQLQSSKGRFERLQEYVAHGAFHDSGERFDPPKCHHNTRVAIIKRIMDWITGLNEDTREALIMWLYGAAGAGKSAIAQTIAEILDGQHFVLASFFFSRNDPQRGTAKLLVTTLAYQLAVKLPLGLSQAFENDPLITTRSLEAQFKALIREPLLELLHSGFSTNNQIVIIIDGLDECHDPKVQARIIDLSFGLLNSRGLPLKILIASRPEIDISSSFDTKPFSTLARIALDNDYQSEDDIRHFLADKFNEIKTQHRLRSYIPIGWPGEDSLDTLAQKSSGQFIYASTVVKYVASARHRPTHRLEVVLGIQLPKAGDSPFAELDALYRHILMGVEDVDLILQVIGFVVLHPPRYYSNSVTFIEAFLSLAPGDIQLLMQNLGSLIAVENHRDNLYDAEMLTVRILHASLKDYLLDQSRSKDFFLDRVKMHTLYAELCLAHITELPSLESNSPLHPSMVKRHWPIFTHFFHHCPLAKPNTQLLQNTLCLTLSRCHTILGVKGHYDTFFSAEYFSYLDSLSAIWADSAISQLYTDEIVALEQLIKAQLGPRPQHSHICFLLASIMNHDSYTYWGFGPISILHILENPRHIAQLGDTLSFLTFRHPVLREHLHNTLQDLNISSQQPADTASVYTSAAIFALRYISTCGFPYTVNTTRFGRSCRYHRTRMNSPAQSFWYRRSVNTVYKMHYTNYRFRNFVQDIGKGVFVDAEFHPMRWYQFNTGEALHAYFWAVLMLPPFLAKSGYSEELIAYARQARIMRNSDYLTFIESLLEDERRSAQGAVNAYLRSVEDGST